MKIFAKVVHYGARTLAVLFAAFLSVFILEGFDPAFGWQSGVAHAIPAAFAIALAFLAHKRPKTGGWLFVGFGLMFLVVVLLTSPMAKAGSAQFLQLLVTMNPLVGFISLIGFLFLLDARFLGQFNKEEGEK